MEKRIRGRQLAAHMSRRRFLQTVGAGTAAIALASHPLRVRASGGAGNLLPAGYLHTDGSNIVGPSGSTVRLAGVNWYGFDCDDMVVGGLDYQTLQTLCRSIVNLGFNSIRLNFCSQMVLENPTVYSGVARMNELWGLRALDVMSALIAEAGAQGLKIILCNQRSEAGWSAESNGLWYGPGIPPGSWMDAWTKIVELYRKDPTVIGVDLRNEPGSPAIDPQAWPQNGGAVWGYEEPTPTGFRRDWAADAETAGNALLDINPNLLIMVEGVRSDPAGPKFQGKTQVYWPGGNLMGVGTAAPPHRMAPRPLTLSVPNRLVYSVHDYGPDIFGGLAWCKLKSTAKTPDACYQIWDQAWGFIVKENIAPIWVGEFGTPNGHKPGEKHPREQYTDPNDTLAQGAWFSYLVQYINDHNLSWAIWALNGSQSAAPTRDPSLPEWYGVLGPDWTSFSSGPMMDRLRAIQ